jgi:hypothetical protein
MADAVTLTEDLRAAISDSTSTFDHCYGPCGLGCWASYSPIAENLLVVVTSAGGPSPALNAEVDHWLARGFGALGVVAASLKPEVVLPSSMRSLVALPYMASVADTTAEIVDLLLLAGAERRAFISYAHQDGRTLAQDVFEALAVSRFDVYLDRFRTKPSSDFVERIDDELRDKSMVVVIETPQAIASTWVLHEIMTAKYRRYGLLALNIGGQPQHPEIGNGRRLTLPTFDKDQVCAAVERHHRMAIVDQRRRRAHALRMALARAARMAALASTVVPDGERCHLVGGQVDYSVLGSFRPAGLREARRIAEYGDQAARRPVLYCPRPTRPEAQSDIAWIDAGTPVAVVHHGRLLHGAAEMAGGRL